MCGILGIWHKTPNEESFKKSLQAINHRGPDDEGIERLNENLLFGFKRLSIIDLSPNGHQPMKSIDGRYTIVFNGEIYNYQELRTILLTKGYQFRSTSDTEVLLYLFAEYGIEMLNKLRGMFAFAIYDKSNDEIYVARDRMGIKPVFYYSDGYTFAFCSELKGLFKYKLIDVEFNTLAVSAFLEFGSMPCPLTLYNNTYSLEPGHYLYYKNNQLSKVCYYSIENTINYQRSYSQTIEELKQLLYDAVKMRLIADVPLGAFLSGGIDSSVVVALMRKANTSKIKTYSISFNEDAFSEQQYSQLVAKHFDTEHKDIIITSSDVKNELYNILDIMDSPTIDGINTYFVSKVTREDGTIVSLSGLGGDELFGGYPSFTEVPRIITIGEKLSFVPKNISRYLSTLSINDKYRKLFDYLANNKSVAAAYFTKRGLMIEPYINQLSNQKVSFDPSSYLSTLHEAPSFTHLNDLISIYELRSYMHNQLLRDTDIMSMAHSLEVRVPLIDHQVVNYAFSIDPKYKVGKQLLKDAFRGELPEIIFNRPKTGFLFPFPVWMRNELLPEIKQLFFLRNIYFNQIQLENIWASYIKGKHSWARVWAICVLNKFLEKNKK